MKGRFRLLNIGAMLILGALSGGSAAAAQGTAATPTALTAEQRARFVLKPEYSDVWYGKSDRIYLHGFWKFTEALNILHIEKGQVLNRETPDPGHDEGLAQGYFRPEYDASGWGEMLVPMPWNYKLTPGKRPERRPFAGIGYYRTEFNVPANRKGKRVFLQFDSVQTSCRVWLNGTEVGGHTNDSKYSGPYWDVNQLLWLDDFELDVTSRVKFGGKNTLVLRVYDDGSVEGNDDRPPDDGGIVGPVSVDFREQIYLPEILVAPDLARQSVNLDILAVNYSSKRQTVELHADCGPFTSRFYSPPVPGQRTRVILGQLQLPPGESRHQFLLKLKDPVLWDIYCPFLYRLRISAGGRMIGQTRFGFRDFRVKGKQFLLNGHPIYLAGSSPQGVGTGIYQFNHANYLRHALQLYREMNFNMLRVHDGPETKVYYDICDELGLISEDDFDHHFRQMAPDEITRGELIREADTTGYLGRNGAFTQKAAATLGKWVTRLHNHPSVCMFTGGNEIGFGVVNAAKEQNTAAFLNAFYDFVKAHDRQQRPVTPSSGLTIWLWHIPVKADYYDYHSYSDGEMGWAFAVEGNRSSWEDLQRIYGSLDKPVINGECVGYNASQDRRDIVDLWREGRLDKAAYVSWAQGLVKTPHLEDANWWDFVTRTRLVRWKGVRSAVTQEAAVRTRAAMTSDVLRVFRRDMPQLQGFVMLGNAPHDFGFPQFRDDLYGADFTEEELLTAQRDWLQNLEIRSLGDALAPQFATLDMYDRNQFTGRPFRATLHLLNFRYRSPEPRLSVELVLRGPVGEYVHIQHLLFTQVPEQSRLSREVEIPLEEALPTGDYTVTVTLLRDKTVLSEDRLPLSVLSRAERDASVASTGAVALYDSSGNHAQGAKPASTQAVLDSLGIKYRLIADFTQIDQYRVLMIGANSLDQIVLDAGDRIRAWVQGGDRLVCFEQTYQGELPFAPGYRLARSGESFFADLIDPDHPAVEGFQAWQWELWNGLEATRDPEAAARGKRIYDGYVLPMSTGVIVSGGDRGRWNTNPVFGMVVGEVKERAGSVFFSQAIATERYDTDSVAHQYLQRVLAYTLRENPQGRAGAQREDQAGLAR